MGARFRLTASALAVATSLCLGAAAGRVVGPIDDPASPPASLPATRTSGASAPTERREPEHAAHAEPADAASAAGQGLLAMAGGYTFSAESAVLDGVPGTPFRFRITDRAGAVVHEYAVVHERRLHLVLVARDLAAYHHLHPTLEADGSWSVALPGLTPGAYRAFADFTVAGGPALTLGLDLFVPGGALYSPLPPPAARVGIHGYDVSLTGAPALGDDDDSDDDGGEVALTVTSGGAPVTDLEPYLAARGHLVVLRTSDLALVHAHPVDDDARAGAAGAATGPTVRFHVAVSAPGDYRMFFEFAHAGVVHAAPFTVHVPPPTP